MKIRTLNWRLIAPRISTLINITTNYKSSLPSKMLEKNEQKKLTKWKTFKQFSLDLNENISENEFLAKQRRRELDKNLTFFSLKLKKFFWLRS